MTPERKQSERQTGTPQTRATQFDGNPSPQPADNDTLRPKDDTPKVLEKKEGPKAARKSE